jgi:hypothetical protein
MKTLSFKKQFMALLLTLSVTALLAPAASAYTVYLLKKDYYAIVCADGQIFSYSGGPAGIGTVGPALCNGHGGIAGGSGGGLTPIKAPANIMRAASSCRGAGNKVIDKQTTQCKTKIRVNRIEMARSVKPETKGHR